MIGRGILHNPWLFEKGAVSQSHGTKEYMELLIKHTKLFNDTWGKTKSFEVMKKFFKVYIKDFRGANELRQQLMGTKSYEEFCEVINNRALR